MPKKVEDDLLSEYQSDFHRAASADLYPYPVISCDAWRAGYGGIYFMQYQAGCCSPEKLLEVFRFNIENDDRFLNLPEEFLHCAIREERLFLATFHPAFSEEIAFMAIATRSQFPQAAQVSHRSKCNKYILLNGLYMYNGLKRVPHKDWGHLSNLFMKYCIITSLTNVAHTLEEGIVFGFNANDAYALKSAQALLHEQFIAAPGDAYLYERMSPNWRGADRAMESLAKSYGRPELGYGYVRSNPQTYPQFAADISQMVGEPIELEAGTPVRVFDPDMSENAWRPRLMLANAHEACEKIYQNMVNFQSAHLADRTLRHVA